jgi:rod shape-determining protein MreC
VKKGKRSVAVVFVVLAVLLAALPVAFPSIVVEASYPIERAWCVMKRHVFSRVAGVFSGAGARAENVRLKRELAALSLNIAEMAEIDAENARLRRALYYVERTKGEYLAAPVLSRGGGAAAVHNVLRVGKGSLAGVCVGAVVVVPQGLVGRVVSVTLHTCEVKLITDASLKVACMSDSLEGGRLYGILSGGGEDSLSLRYISGAANVPDRTRIITSGEGGVFPEGIDVGVWLGDGAVLPSVAFSTLEDVFIRCAK